MARTNAFCIFKVLFHCTEIKKKKCNFSIRWEKCFASWSDDVKIFVMIPVAQNKNNVVTALLCHATIFASHFGRMRSKVELIVNTFALPSDVSKDFPHKFFLITALLRKTPISEPGKAASFGL